MALKEKEAAIIAGQMARRCANITRIVIGSAILVATVVTYICWMLHLVDAETLFTLAWTALALVGVSGVTGFIFGRIRW